MTAGIFAQHGVWVGPSRGADSRNAKGYFESQPFKEALLHHCGALVTAGRVADPVPEWPEIARTILQQHGYTGGPWLVKHSAVYWPVWQAMNPYWLCVRRNLDSVQRSGQATSYLRNPGAIPVHVEQMDYVRDRLGGVDVFTDELVAGDYSSLRRAFKYCGLGFTPTIADNFIDPSLWHYG